MILNFISNLFFGLTCVILMPYRVISSVGAVTLEVVKKYIEEQKNV